MHGHPLWTLSLTSTEPLMPTTTEFTFSLFTTLHTHFPSAPQTYSLHCCMAIRGLINVHHTFLQPLTCHYMSFIPIIIDTHSSSHMSLPFLSYPWSHLTFYLSYWPNPSIPLFFITHPVGYIPYLSYLSALIIHAYGTWVIRTPSSAFNEKNWAFAFALNFETCWIKARFQEEDWLISNLSQKCRENGNWHG